MLMLPVGQLAYRSQATNTSPLGDTAGQAPWTTPAALKLIGDDQLSPPFVERTARIGVPLAPKSVHTRYKLP